MKMPRILKLVLTSLALVAGVSLQPALAQTWPAKSITMIVPQGAGGSTDALARLVGQALGERLGQTVIIDNRAGAGGVLGVVAAVKAPADGYTILIGSNTTVAANAFLYKNYPLDSAEGLRAARAGGRRALRLRGAGELADQVDPRPGRRGQGRARQAQLRFGHQLGPVVHGVLQRGCRHPYWSGSPTSPRRRP